MKAEIVFRNHQPTWTIESNKSFEKFIIQLFKAKIYLSKSERSPSLAINTEEIIYVKEIRE